MANLNDLRKSLAKVQVPGGGSGIGGKLGGALILTGAALFLGYESLYTGMKYLLHVVIFEVEPGHRGVVFNRFFGVKQQIYNEGTHFILPFIEVPVTFNVRSKPRNFSSPTGSKGCLHLFNR